jgi:hypothetical protein
MIPNQNQIKEFPNSNEKDQFNEDLSENEDEDDVEDSPIKKVHHHHEV